MGTTLEAGTTEAGGASDFAAGGTDDGPIEEGGAEMLAGASETRMLGGAALIAAALADNEATPCDADADGGEEGSGVATAEEDAREAGKGVATADTEGGGGVLETRSASSFRLGRAAR